MSVAGAYTQTHGFSGEGSLPVWRGWYAELASRKGTRALDEILSGAFSLCVQDG